MKTNKFLKSGQPYIGRGEQKVSMATIDNCIIFSVKSDLKELAKINKNSDEFVVTISSDNGSSMTFPFKMGIGFRDFQIRGQNKVPVAPSINTVIESVSSDVSSFLSLPYDEGSALDQIGSDFGYDKPSQCLKVLKELRNMADGVNRLLGGKFNLQQFVDWSFSEQFLAKSIVQSEKNDGFIIKLPEVDPDNNGDTYTGYLRVTLNNSTGNYLTKSLEKVESTYVLRNHLTVFKKDNGADFSFEEGQSFSDAKNIWANSPEIVEMLDIVSRYNLNDCHAGTFKQDAVDFIGRSNNYDDKCKLLKEHNLLNDNGYVFGTSWLVLPIPEDVISKIKSWDNSSFENIEDKSLIIK